MLSILVAYWAEALVATGRHQGLVQEPQCTWAAGTKDLMGPPAGENREKGTSMFERQLSPLRKRFFERLRSTRPAMAVATLASESVDRHCSFPEGR